MAVTDSVSRLKSTPLESRLKKSESNGVTLSGRPIEHFGGLSAENFGRNSAETLSVLIWPFGVSAETASFGRKAFFRQK